VRLFKIPKKYQLTVCSPQSSTYSSFDASQTSARQTPASFTETDFKPIHTPCKDFIRRKKYVRQLLGTAGESS